jgi:hypothetical protein
MGSHKIFAGGKAQQRPQPAVSNQGAFSSWILNFVVTSVTPFRRVIDDTSAHHIHVDVNDAPQQMFARFNSRGVIPILPKGALATLMDVVFLPCTAGHQSQRFWDHISPSVVNHK